LLLTFISLLTRITPDTYYHSQSRGRRRLIFPRLAGQQPDAREGVEAFLAHRTAHWQLRKVSDRPEQILDGEASPEARR
jgi:hypothetical protein